MPDKLPKSDPRILKGVIALKFLIDKKLPCPFTSGKNCVPGICPLYERVQLATILTYQRKATRLLREEGIFLGPEDYLGDLKATTEQYIGAADLLTPIGVRLALTEGCAHRTSPIHPN